MIFSEFTINTLKCIFGFLLIFFVFIIFDYVDYLKRQIENCITKINNLKIDMYGNKEINYIEDIIDNKINIYNNKLNSIFKKYDEDSLVLYNKFEERLKKYDEDIIALYNNINIISTNIEKIHNLTFNINNFNYNNEILIQNINNDIMDMKSLIQKNGYDISILQYKITDFNVQTKHKLDNIISRNKVNEMILKHKFTENNHKFTLSLWLDSFYLDIFHNANIKSTILHFNDIKNIIHINVKFSDFYEKILYEYNILKNLYIKMKNPILLEPWTKINELELSNTQKNNLKLLYPVSS